MAWYDVVSIIALIIAFFAGAILTLKTAFIPPRIKAILLDADGTLLDFDRSERAALQETFETLSLPFDQTTYEVYHRNNDWCWKALERGEISRDELKVRRYRMTFEELDLSADPALATKTYEGILGNYAFPFEGAEKTCERLSKKYDLYIVTNGLKHVQTARMLRTKIPEVVKGIYISEDVGYTKPAPEFFDRVFSDHPKLRREETLIVGDSLTGDMQGGNNAGILTCWVNRHGAETPKDLRIDFEIDHITKLEKVL